MEHQMQRVSLQSGWQKVQLREVCEINPSRPSGFQRHADAITTFIPMAALDGDIGAIVSTEQRPYAEVAKGYTFFVEGDVLFAKITPCMQNKKSAVARGLIDGIGFGTTEFHVLRPKTDVLAEWIYYQVRESRFLSLAEANFTGAVGQQRVPASFIEQYSIPLPPLSEQRAIVRHLERDMAKVEQLRAAAERQREAITALSGACLREIFESEEAKGWEHVLLGDILRLRKEVIHPHNNPSGSATFVGLEHIESHTGRRIGSVNVEMSQLTGRKPQFFHKDIVYGYLRPYLNKVWVADSDGLCSVDQYVYSVAPERADTQYVAAFMRSPLYLERAPISTTPGQLPRIRIEEVAAVTIALPPLEYQQTLVKRLDEETRQITQLQQQFDRQRMAIEALPEELLREVFG